MADARRAKKAGRAASAKKRAPAGAALRAKVAQAAKLSRAFHGKKPDRIVRAKAPSVTVAMKLGKLLGVIYEVPDGTQYLHEFRGQARPTLAATHDGRQLIVQGGRYRMTGRGIVDKRK